MYRIKMGINEAILEDTIEQYSPDEALDEFIGKYNIDKWSVDWVKITRVEQ